MSMDSSWLDGFPMLMNNGQIDSQHCCMFNFLDNHYRSNRDGSTREETEDVLSFLLSYAAIHFADEETLMAEYSYAEQAVHIAEHSVITAKIGEMVAAHRDGRGYDSLSLSDFIEAHLVPHLFGADQELARWMKPRQDDRDDLFRLSPACDHPGRFTC